MKRTMFLMLSLAVLAGLSGCAMHRGHRTGVCADGTCVTAPEGFAQAGDCGGAPGGAACGNCDDPNGAACGQDCGGRCKKCKGPGRPSGIFNAGPPAAQVAYPYYTVRGPRDFLAKSPSSIGP